MTKRASKRAPVSKRDPAAALRLSLHLNSLMANLVDDLASRDLDISEGLVLTVGPPPYRRLDCDSRALAYVRVRPRREAVRIDMSGLWKVPRSSPLILPSAGGPATLLVKNERERREAVDFLCAAVRLTRAALKDEADLKRKIASQVNDPPHKIAGEVSDPEDPSRSPG